MPFKKGNPKPANSGRRKKTSEPIISPINSMQIEWWDVNRPIDYPLNARKWKPEAVAKVADSIKRYGWRQPIVVDDAGVIVIGHLRRMAARQAGLSPVPVHVAAELSPEAVRGLRLADNRTHDEAAWDLELLAREFGELKALNFELAATGFDLVQVDSYLRGANFQPASEAEQGRLDQKKPMKCPECGHEFTA